MIRETIQIYRERGMENLMHKILDYLNWRSKIIVGTISNKYWSLRGGKQTFIVNGVCATFDASPANGGDTIRGQMRSEYDLLSEIIAEIDDEDVFFDVGANLGLHSNFAAQVCKSVIAFEPYPPNYNQLLSNISKDLDNVDIYQLALSDSDGKAEFAVSDPRVGHATGGLKEGGVSVRTAKGDSIVEREGLESPDVVKIDVEGAEGKVVEGMRDTLSNCRKIYCEVHLPANQRESIESYDWKFLEFLNELADLGFDIHILKTRGPEMQIIGERQ